MDVAIVTADKVAVKGFDRTEFTCDDYSTDQPDMDWWDDDCDDVSDDWEEIEVEDAGTPDEQLEEEGMQEEIELMKEFGVFEPKSRDELEGYKFLSKRWVKQRRGQEDSNAIRGQGVQSR